MIKLMVWGNIRTTMFETNCHLTDRDIDKEVLEKNGIKCPEDGQSRAMAPRQCGHCHAINGPTACFCSMCGRPLNQEVHLSMEEITRAIESTPEYQLIMDMVRAKIQKGIA